MIVAALLNAFARTEEDFLRLSVDAKEFSGACVNVVLMFRDTIYVANLGDCRAVLGRGKGKAIGLSRDHKASIEKSRIRKVGGFVKNGRVNGILAISRTIGDREFKDPVAMAPSPSSSPVITSSHFSNRPGQSARPGSSPSNATGAHMPVTRRVSNPSNIVLKNVRDTSDSPARTRLRNSTSLLQSASSPTANGSDPNGLSKSAVVNGSSTSREPSPSPIPFSVVDRPLAASTPDAGESKSKKRRSTPTSASKKHSRSSTSADSAESSDTVLYPIKDEEEEHMSKEADGDDDSMADTALKTPVEPPTPVFVAPASPTPSKASRRASSKPPKSSSSSPPPSKPSSPPPSKSSSANASPPPASLSVSSSTSSSNEEQSSVRKSKKEKDLASSSESFDSEGSEAVEGMFDVVECYDPELKQKKFGFKKRRPPKDPKSDTATVVSAIPEITIMRRTTEDDWLFLASDGFYDLFTSKQTGVAVSKHLQRCGRDRLTDTVKSLCEEASLLGSEDDITGVLILLKPTSGPSESPSLLAVASTNANLMAGSSEP